MPYVAEKASMNLRGSDFDGTRYKGASRVERVNGYVARIVTALSHM